MTRHCLALCALVAACSDSSGTPTHPDFAAGDSAYCVTLAVDYKNNVGAMAAVALPSMTVTQDILHGTISGDPVIRAVGKKLYVVNRTAGNVTIIDTSNTDWSVDAQFSTGTTANPQDVAVAGNKLYVATYAGPGVEVFDLGTKAMTGTVDLSSLDPDGEPNAQSVAVVGNTAYVTLDLLDTATPPSPRGPGKVAMINTTTDTVSGTLDLNFADPYGFFVPVGSVLLVPTLADFSGQTGCVEEVLTTSPPTVSPCLVENSAFGGTVSAIARSSLGSTYLAVSTFDATFNQTATVRQLDAAGVLQPDPMTPSTQLPTDLALAPSGQLVYADQTGGGIRVYDLGMNKELTTAPLALGLPPGSQDDIVCLSR